MASTKRFLRSFYRLLLPTVILVVLAMVASSIWLLYQVSNPPKAAYLITPDKYGRLSSRAAQVTEEGWMNRDGSPARGWLLRGAEGAPAVILVHRYGADRSWVLDLGVKLNEATNYTVLMPDGRAHGENPLARKTTFGGDEAEDMSAAIEYLGNLQNSARNSALTNREVGIYGVEIGAFAGLVAASKSENVKALALDSVPESSNALLASVIEKKFPFASGLTSRIAAGGTYLFYIQDNYDREPVCQVAKSVANRKILLLAGSNAPDYQESTRSLQNCLPADGTQANLDLAFSNYGLNVASLEQKAIYDQRVIEFFKQAMGTFEMPLEAPTFAPASISEVTNPNANTNVNANINSNANVNLKP